MKPNMDPGTLRRRQGPDTTLRDHGFREPDQLAVLAVVHVDVTRLASVDDGGDDLPVLVLRVHQDGRAGRVQIPDIMGDVLEVPLVLS